ncbi:MAG: hypothetical protein P8J20_19480 [Novosphingobium sp.]|nr:hypothetical protein [Novosphingobium sp.]
MRRMDQPKKRRGRMQIGRGHLALGLRLSTVALAVAALGPMTGAPLPLASPAIGEATSVELPQPPADGVMGFVVESFVQPIVRDGVSCPDGTALRLRDRYLATLSEAERTRLALKENEKELTNLWRAYAMGPKRTNICTHPEMFDRPLIRTVQSPLGDGLDLDGDGGAGAGGSNGCAQTDFTSPTGEKGIDNQEYRVMGCTREWRGIEGSKGDQETGLKQFFASGEWSQAILLRGVDSLVNDDDVEVIYGNTPDRPFADKDGNFLPGGTFTLSDKAPRFRNALKGRIVNGVLTTEPKNIRLVQTWGQGGARDIRGNRTSFDYREGRLRMTFQPDGTLTGMLGGYRPVFDVIVSPALGGVGSAVVAGIDCAGELATLKAMADGLRNPETGQCEGVSSAQQIKAVPAFVNDVPKPMRTAAR